MYISKKIINIVCITTLLTVSGWMMIQLQANNSYINFGQIEIMNNKRYQSQTTSNYSNISIIRRHTKFNQLNKIFQISSGCSGCRSMKIYFTETNNFRGAVYKFRRRGLWQILLANYKTDKPLLHGIPSKIRYFGDFKPNSIPNINGNKTYIEFKTKENIKIIQLLDEQYPNSIFIFNIRPLSHIIKCLIDFPVKINATYTIPKWKKWTHIFTRTELFMKKFDQYLNFFCKIRDYFGERLIIFDIERDSVQELKERFYNQTRIHLIGDFPKSNHHSDHFISEEEQSGKTSLNTFCDLYV